MWKLKSRFLQWLCSVLFQDPRKILHFWLIRKAKHCCLCLNRPCIWTPCWPSPTRPRIHLGFPSNQVDSCFHLEDGYHGQTLWLDDDGPCRNGLMRPALENWLHFTPVATPPLHSPVSLTIISLQLDCWCVVSNHVWTKTWTHKWSHSLLSYVFLSWWFHVYLKVLFWVFLLFFFLIHLFLVSCSEIRIGANHEFFPTATNRRCLKPIRQEFLDHHGLWITADSTCSFTNSLFTDGSFCTCFLARYKKPQWWTNLFKVCSSSPQFHVDVAAMSRPQAFPSAPGLVGCSWLSLTSDVSTVIMAIKLTANNYKMFIS